MNLIENIAMKKCQASQKRICLKYVQKHNWYLKQFKPWWKLNLVIDIEEDPFETLDINEVAMNNDNNECIKMTINLENKGNMILQKIKPKRKC